MVMSPFVVPLGAFAMTLGIVVASLMLNAHERRLRAEQTMAMVNRGMPIEDIERLLRKRDDEEHVGRDPLRSLSNARRAGILLISTGVGLMLFFAVLFAVIHVPGVLIGGAAGLIPFAIGIGFLVDYKFQQGDLARFAMEVGADLPGVGGRDRTHT